MLYRLLRKNMSAGRIAGFIVADFLGLAIILGAIQFYLDARSIWSDSESILRSDYIVINKRVTSRNTLGASNAFSADDVAALESQPWVSSVAPFSTADYRVYASLNQQGRALSTSMFFESLPEDFVDVPRSQWQWREGSDEVPLIISKDYLTLYNFGFAASAGLPQMSEGLMSGIPLRLTLISDDGQRQISVNGRVAGYSNRLNTILVPQNFMDFTNQRLGSGAEKLPSRLIIKVSKPGDTAIAEYLSDHDYETAGDKSASSASFLLRLVIGIVMIIGIVITVLSFFILLLSISLLMEKNRDKIHSLLMLGYEPSRIGTPYNNIVIVSSVVAAVLAFGGVMALRLAYVEPLQSMGGAPGSVWAVAGAAVAITALVIIVNLGAIRRRVRGAWR